MIVNKSMGILMLDGSWKIASPLFISNYSPSTYEWPLSFYIPKRDKTKVNFKFWKKSRNNRLFYRQAEDE